MLESPGFCCKTGQEKRGNIWWHTIGIITKQRSAPQTGRGAQSRTSSPSGQGMKYSGHLTERAKSGLLLQRLVTQLKDRRYFPLWTSWTACESHEHEMMAQVTIKCQSSGFTTFYGGETYFHLCAPERRSYKGVILFAWLWQKQDCSRNIRTLENCAWRTALSVLLFSTRRAPEPLHFSCRRWERGVKLCCIESCFLFFFLSF